MALTLGRIRKFLENIKKLVKLSKPRDLKKYLHG